jgi:hypothetical protein
LERVEDAVQPDVEQALVPWQAVAAHGAGTYINFQGSATASDLAAAYPPETYARLAAVKCAYDPRKPQPHPIDGALAAFCRLAMCGNVEMSWKGDGTRAHTAFRGTQQRS